MPDVEDEMQFRTFVVRGRVYSGNRSHAKHSIYWALADSGWSDEILIDEITITEGKQNATVQP